MNGDAFPILRDFYPFILTAIVFEIAWYAVVRRQAYPWKELLATTGTFLLGLPAKLLRVAVLVPIGALLWQYRLFTVPLDGWWGWALTFLGVEFCYYWMHRADHEVRWLWATHAVHHTPERIHLASAFRLGITNLISGGWLFFVPLYLLGFDPVAVATMQAFNLFYQFWLHTDIVGKLGPLEWVLNTPSHHRVHHASNPEYLDRNYGGVVIFWDRLFGSFAEERADLPIAYGLVHPVGSYNPLEIAFHQWVQMARDVAASRGWRARLRQAFGRPDESLGVPASRAPVPAHTRHAAAAP
jgi:sterol desaturase/sphingolipid hydroxylase (fatty acid hydroxylase superfamily)